MWYDTSQTNCCLVTFCEVFDIVPLHKGVPSLDHVLCCHKTCRCTVKIDGILLGQIFLLALYKVSFLTLVTSTLRMEAVYFYETLAYDQNGTQ